MKTCSFSVPRTAATMPRGSHGGGGQATNGQLIGLTIFCIIGWLVLAGIAFGWFDKLKQWWRR